MQARRERMNTQFIIRFNIRNDSIPSLCIVPFELQVTILNFDDHVQAAPVPR